MKTKLYYLSAIVLIAVAAIVAVIYQQKTINHLKNFKVIHIKDIEKKRMENILLKEGFSTRTIL